MLRFPTVAPPRHFFSKKRGNKEKRGGEQHGLQNGQKWRGGATVGNINNGVQIWPRHLARVTAAPPLLKFALKAAAIPAGRLPPRDSVGAAGTRMRIRPHGYQHHRLTQRVLCARLGVSRSTIYRWRRLGLLPLPCRGPAVDVRCKSHLLGQRPYELNAFIERVKARDSTLRLRARPALRRLMRRLAQDEKE